MTGGTDSMPPAGEMVFLAGGEVCARLGVRWVPKPKGEWQGQEGTGGDDKRRGDLHQL